MGRKYTFEGRDYPLQRIDSQRQRCYNAEQEAFQANRFRVMDGPTGEQGDLEAVRLLVEEVLRSSTWEHLCRQHGRTKVPRTVSREGAPGDIDVEDGRGARCAKGWYNGISCPRRMRSKVVVLHELAHVVAFKCSHHWPWANAFLALVGRFLGRADRDALEAAYKKNGVRWTPKARRAMTQEALERLRAQGHRLAAAEKRNPKGNPPKGNDGLDELRKLLSF